MIFPTLSANLAQALPEPLKNKVLGLPQPPGAPTPDAPQERYTKNPPEKPESTWAKAKHALFNVFHRDHGEKPLNQGQTGMPNGNFPNGGNPTLVNPGAMQPPSETVGGVGNGTSAPGSNLKPLTVEQMFNRMPKQFQFKKPVKPKYTLTPDEIRDNPQQRYFACVDHYVEGMPWNDDDVINPLNMGPGSESE